MASPIIALSTCPTLSESKKLAKRLVQRKLAACVNIIGPIRSFYTWEDKLQEETEFKLFIKTVENKWKELLEFFNTNHSYSVPEVTKMKIEDMDPKYLSWLVENTL